MDFVTVECLRCGRCRQMSPAPSHAEDAGECGRCGYVGWAYSTELSERTRRLFRDLPIERRLQIRTLAPR